MSLFCSHIYKPSHVARGENLLGDVMYAIVFYCVKCNKSKLDKGWSKDGAEEHIEWLNRNWEIVASNQPVEEKLDTRELTLKGEAHEKKSKTEDPGNNNRQH